MSAMSRVVSVVASVALAWLAAAAPAAAAAGPWASTAEVAVRLVSPVQAGGDGATVPLGLDIRLQPGWKTYWRSPGDAGLPPRVDWAGSTNLKAAVLSWPAPRRVELLGIDSNAYEGHVLLPVSATVTKPGAPLDLHAKVDLLVCSDICVPRRLEAGLSLPAGPAVPGPEAALVARFVARVPGDGVAAGLAIDRVTADGSNLVVHVRSATPLVRPDLFVESGRPLAFSPPRIALADGGRTATMRVAVASPDGHAVTPPSGTRLTLTLVDGDRAMAATRTLAAAAPGPGLGAILAVALLGGLILNLMPCVLPVLSLKLLAIVRAGGETRRMRRDLAVSAVGIIISFLALAAAAIALKTAGSAVGWGMQFQEPAFVAVMAAVVTLFACNLWGLFEVPLPWRIADRAQGVAGPLATGMFATLLATPCSAPFLGTAVSFALSRGPVQIALVFAVLGLGMALPYLAVAAMPGVARLLPRPGRWMMVVRRLLGLALAATALWLVAILGAETGPLLAGGIGGLLLALVLVLALRRLPAAARVAGAALAVILAVGASAAVPGRPTAAPAAAQAARWQPFAPDRIAGLVSSGHVVFVDVTADWCLTCKVNERLVLDDRSVSRHLFRPPIVAMRADWTRPSDAITRYLQGFGRYGIPFNVVYGPGAPDGVTLPELLTADAVLKALDKAAGPGSTASAAVPPAGKGG